MAWMPWNVHYFLFESYKAYSFTLQSSGFCYLNNKYFNNRCEFSTHKTNKSGVEFVPLCGAFIEETFTVWTVFTLNIRARLLSFPVVLFLSSCSTAATLVNFYHHPTSHIVFIAYWITTTLQSDSWELWNQIILLLLVTEGKGKS